MSRCVSDRFVLAAIGLYAALCPYSKVEESFGLQATHDLLFLGPRPEALQSFDHLEFPGVVPRTFVGPAITSAIVWPLHVLSEFSRRASVHDAVASQLLVRSALGLLFWFAYRSLREATAKRFSKRAGSMFGWLTFAQFHILYYCTRTLPNSFALVVTSVGFSLWLKGRATAALCVVAAAMVLFRCDMVLLLAPMVLATLLSGEAKLVPTAATGIMSSLLALALTVFVDSYFWKRWLYPEGEVLFFNTVENRSSEWGVSPWHWYITNALPKGLLLSFPLCILGFIGITFPTSLTLPTPLPSSLFGQLSAAVSSSFAWSPAASPAASKRHRELLYYCGPALVFVALYSYLPHKELRFLFPALPLLTLAAALEADLLLPPPPSSSLGAAETTGSPEACPFMKGDLAAVKMLPNPHLKNAGTSHPVTSNKTLVAFISRMYSGIFYAAYIASLLPIGFFLSASHRNYPGGAAMEVLNAEVERDLRTQGAIRTRSDASGVWDCINSNGTTFEPVRVHIDVLACVSGVTRYLEMRGLPLCNSSTLADPVPFVRYSKDESLVRAEQLLQFDYVITTPDMFSHGVRLCNAESSSCAASSAGFSSGLSNHFDLLSGSFIEAFRRFSVQVSELRRGRWPVSLVMSPELAVLKRKRKE